jgi:uridine phosphorylase
LKCAASATGINGMRVDDEGRTYSIGYRPGEVSDAVLLLSDYELAEAIAGFFDELKFKRASNCGYTTYTGVYKGACLSIVAFGIGSAVTDLLLHELRSAVTGPLTLLQIGTAPTPMNLPLGTAIVVTDAVVYQLEFDNFLKCAASPYRIFAKPVRAASAVVAAAEAGLRVLQLPYEFGRVASSSSFTAGIAAPPMGFDFNAEGLLYRIIQACGPISSFEMDTFSLLWMSLAATGDEIWAGAISVIGSNLRGDVWPAEKIRDRMLVIGKMMLAQLAALQNARYD